MAKAYNGKYFITFTRSACDIYTLFNHTSERLIIETELYSSMDVDLCNKYHSIHAYMNGVAILNNKL